MHRYKSFGLKYSLLKFNLEKWTFVDSAIEENFHWVKWSLIFSWNYAITVRFIVQKLSFTFLACKYPNKSHKGMKYLEETKGNYNLIHHKQPPKYWCRSLFWKKQCYPKNFLKFSEEIFYRAASIESRKQFRKIPSDPQVYLVLSAAPNWIKYTLRRRF